MWIYIIIGILQGIFEWVPISSEGIVALASQYLIKGVKPVDMAIFLHLGTLLAVLIYFRKDWKEVLLFRNKKLLYFLTLTTFVSLGVGFILYNLISTLFLGTLLLVLVGFGLIMTSFLHKTRENKEKETKSKLSFQNIAILSGLLQGLAVIPGLSRSGSTIFGLSLGKLSPQQILKLSYMMSAPVILASSAYLVLKNPVLITGWPALISSFVFGIGTLHILMKYSQKINFYKFTLFFGLLCLVGAVISIL